MEIRISIQSAIIILLAVCVLTMGCSIPCHKISKAKQVEILRADFEETTHGHKNMTDEGKLFLIQGWWDLQEIKAITADAKEIH